MPDEIVSYVAMLEPGERSGYVVSFPDLDGCLADGETVREATLMAQDAMTVYLSALKQLREPFPPPAFNPRGVLDPNTYVGITIKITIKRSDLTDLVQEQ